MATRGDKPRSILREVIVGVLIAGVAGSLSGMATTYYRSQDHERRIGVMEQLVREVREDVAWIRGRMEGKP